jgi:hypothetical protein
VHQPTRVVAPVFTTFGTRRRARVPYIGAYQRRGGAKHMQTLRDSGYRTFEGLKRSRAVGAIGIGVNEREVLLEAMVREEGYGRCHACTAVSLQSQI